MKQEEEDDDRMFMLSLLNPLKSIPKERKVAARIRLMSVIDEAQAAEHHLSRYESHPRYDDHQRYEGHRRYEYHPRHEFLQQPGNWSGERGEMSTSSHHHGFSAPPTQPVRYASHPSTTLTILGGTSGQQHTEHHRSEYSHRDVISPASTAATNDSEYS